MKRLKYILLGLALLPMFFAAQAHASIQLGFLVDSSGSIGSGNFTTIRNGMSNAMAAVLPIDSSVEVSVVRFASSATTIVGPTLISSQAVLNNVVALVQGMAYTSGSTNMAAGISTLTSQIQSSGLYNANNSIIYNIVTDGFPDSESAALTARSAAITAGVDEIDAEFIGTVGDFGYNFLLNQMVYPQPGHAAPPDFSPGFVIAVSFNNFQDAFTAKLEQVVGPEPEGVPEPGSIFVFAGLGLLAIGYRRWRGRL